jgi:ABC-type molybdate transport system substrate-binding protein
MVCPHDTAGDPIKWFQFAQYLTKYCKTSTKYYKCLDFVEFHQKMSEADIVYANPQDSLELLEKFNYIPLVHSTNLYDEIVFIANNGTKNDSLADINDKDCFSCNGMMVTRIGIKGLIEKGHKPKRIYSKDNWMAVVKAVSQGEKDYGFVYKDFYDGLNKLSKSLVTNIGETNERSIFHSVFIKAEHSDKGEAITKILTDAHNTDKGRLTLKDVNIDKFIPVTKEEILNFKSLLGLESEIME